MNQNTFPADPLPPEARARLEEQADEHEDHARRFTGYHAEAARRGDRSEWDTRASEEKAIAEAIRQALASHDALGARIGELEGRMAYLAHVLNVVRRDATFDEHLSFVLKAAILIATKESAGLRAALSPPPTTPQEETPKPGLMVLGQFCAEIDRLSAALQAVEGRLERAEKALREIDRCPSDTTQEHLKGFARAYFEATP